MAVLRRVGDRWVNPDRHDARAPQSCASDHQPTIWVYRDGANRSCYCGYYLFRV